MSKHGKEIVFKILNPLSIGNVVKYILENKKTSMKVRSHLYRPHHFVCEVDISKLMLMIKEYSRDGMLYEIPVIPIEKDENIPFDWVTSENINKIVFLEE